MNYLKTNATSQTSNASNLNAKNIYVNTDEKLSTNTNIVGSNVVADENLYINTNNLNVKASQDTSTSSQDSKTINGSVAFTMYGGGGGTAGLGYGQQNSDSNTLINNNSILQGNNVNINASNDAIFQGANVRANDTLNLNVGNNLTLESLRDEYSSNQKGFNVNAGIGFGSAGASANRTPSLDVGKQSSTNAGFSVNNGTTVNKQTVLSSITGNKVNVNVGNNTHLKGALLASGEFQDDGSFVDNKNLNFSTNTLTFENLSNTTYSSNQSIGGSLNYNLTDSRIVNTKEKKDIEKGISSVKYNSDKSLLVNASKTLATLGQGNININDIENSDEIERLNTDTSKINKDLYSSSTGTKVDATLDTRLLTEKGREEIAKDYEKAKKIINTVDKIVKTEDVSISDFFKEVEKSSKMQDVIQSLIEQNPNIVNSITNSNESISQNKEAMQIIAMTILNEYGYSLDQIKFVYTDETGQADKQFQGFVTTQNDNIYLNLKNIDNMGNMLTTLGQEIAGLTQKNENIDITTNRDEHNKYQDMVSKDLVKDVEFALSLNDNQIDNAKLQTKVNSIEEYLAIQKANSEFSSLDKEAGDNFAPAVILGAIAIQSYLNAPKDETDIKEGTTGSENLLLGVGVVSNTGKIYTTGKEAVQTVLKYDPSLAITGVGVSTGMSAYTNYDKYNGLEYVTHVGIDGTISYLVGKYIPGGKNIASSIGYGTLGGALSGASTETLHQSVDVYAFDNQKSFDKNNVFLNSGIEATAGAHGKLYKNIGEMLELKPVINYGMDIGISQSFKPVIEATMLNDVSNEETK